MPSNLSHTSSTSMLDILPVPHDSCSQKGEIPHNLVVAVAGHRWCTSISLEHARQHYENVAKAISVVWTV